MRKIFLIVFLFFCNFFVTMAYESPKIITREEWGANDEYLFKDSSEWQKIFEAKKVNNSKPKTPEQIKKAEAATEKTRKINEYLMTNFWEENSISNTEKYYKWRELIWPIEHSSKIRAIVVHHTHSSFKDAYEWIRSIYRYHALRNQRWDIGYNFLIWPSGEIFEWRAGWETAVWAHAVWNNRQTIWISLMGNYNEVEISDAQYKSLENLIKYLVEKYNIDLYKKQPFSRTCSNCWKPLETNYYYPIIWHRDAWHTDCPGQKLYEQLQVLRQNIQSERRGKISEQIDSESKKFFAIFDRIWEKKLLEIMLKIETMLDVSYNDKLVLLKKYIINYFESKNKPTLVDTDKEIKVKLSYPEKLDFITISDGNKEYKIEKQNWKLLVDGSEQENFILENSLHPYLEITSWDRTPVWHKEGIYKDNKFRWKIYVYLKWDKFVVVNILKLEDYLKWLGEISNTENKEKAKTIIISARTYALWYIEKDRKFKWEDYDASDDPDIFQKYLGYDLERRSPKLNEIVEETKWIVLKYNSEIIKPWYFSTSSGETLSFYDYCIKNKNSINFCEKESEKYPFLQAKKDPGSKDWLQRGHWVGLPGTWATYFSSRDWPYHMILKYFYENIEL